MLNDDSPPSGVSRQSRLPHYSPAKLAVALTLSEYFKAWRISARAEDDPSSIYVATSNDNDTDIDDDDEGSVNKKARQTDKATTAQATFTSIRIFSVIFLILVLVSFLTFLTACSAEPYFPPY